MPFLIERFVQLAKSPQFAPQFPQGFAGVATNSTTTPRDVESCGDVGVERSCRSRRSCSGPTPFRDAAEHVKGLKDCGVFDPTVPGHRSAERARCSTI